MFDHCCLRRISGVNLRDRVSNIEIRRRVFGNNASVCSLEQVLNLHRLRWLGHVLRMPSNRLPRRVLLSEVPLEWKRVRGGQCATWARNMKALTVGLSHVGRCRLPGWGPRDQPNEWLETLCEMAECGDQWRKCIYFLVSHT